MQIYPIRDASNVIGVVSFETSMEEAKLEDHQLLVETAQLMLTTLRIPSKAVKYTVLCRPVMVFCLLMNKGKLYLPIQLLTVSTKC